MIIKTPKGEEITVDSHWFEYLNQFSWYINGKGYAYRVSYEDGKRVNITMHREIMGFPDHFTDHKNRNKLDNQEANLRKSSHSQNEMNKDIGKKNTSGYKGVDIHKKSGKFRARIVKDKKEYHLGLFDNPEDAARMYNIWAADIFGEFAVFNQIGGN